MEKLRAKKKCKKNPIECSWDDIPNRGNGTLPIIYIHTTTVIYQNGCFVVNPVLLLVIFLWVLYEFFFIRIRLETVFIEWLI